MPHICLCFLFFGKENVFYYVCKHAAVVQRSSEDMPGQDATENTHILTWFCDIVVRAFIFIHGVF